MVPAGETYGFRGRPFYHPTPFGYLFGYLLRGRRTPA